MLPRALAILLVLLSGTVARAEALAPFKDRLFAHPGVIATRDDGAHVTVDYREMRDINGRDEVPERRARSEYVALGVRSAQKDLVLRSEAGDIAHFAVGQTRGARVITVYLHGQGGSRRQGVDDFTFGGNFNRIKNLMVENGGLYLSPDFADFAEKGAAQVRALIDHYRASSPGVRVFVACGSMGGALCWRLAQDSDVGERLSGFLLLGSNRDAGFVGSPAFRARVPLYVGHGSRDRVFSVETIEEFFAGVRAAAPGYPARLVRFESGTHGTPIRMTDWRETINWMLEAR
jgi:hypothetical protein